MTWDIFKQTYINNGNGGHFCIREYIGILQYVDEMSIDETIEMLADHYDCGSSDIELEAKL